MIVIPRQEEDAFMLTMRAAAPPLRYGVLLPPYDLAAIDEAFVTQRNHKPVGKREQIAVGKPTFFTVYESPALRPWLSIGAVVFVKSILIGA